MSRTFFLALLVILVAVIPHATAYADRYMQDDRASSNNNGASYMSTREEVLAKRERRRKEFSARVEDWKEQLDHHETGRRRLEEADVASIQMKIDVYQRKLEYHLNGEMDIRQVDRILAREEIQSERYWERRARSQGREL